jgi:hypothetical protein
MKDRITHGGSAITVTEYEVRDIDEYGDAQDVNHYENKREAIDAAKKALTAGTKAVAVEKHISRRPAFLFAEPDTFTTIAVMGDKSALELWGWKPGDTTWTE